MNNQSLSTFLNEIAAKTPTPGGGAVASVTAALAAAIAQMVVNFSVGKKSLAANDQLHRSALDQLQSMRDRALQLAGDDAAAYAVMNAVWKLDKADPRREREMPAAVTTAIEPPSNVLRLSREVLVLLRNLVGKTNTHLASDLAVAAILAEAAARAAAWNVRINLPLLNDDSHRANLEQETSRIVGECQAMAQAIEAACGSR